MVTDITQMVGGAVGRAREKAPRGIVINNSIGGVAVIKSGVVVGLRNWVYNTGTHRIKCRVYVSNRLTSIAETGPLESTLEADNADELVWSVVMAVAMGAYDHVPE